MANADRKRGRRGLRGVIIREAADSCIWDARECKPGSLALTRMAVGRDGWSEEATEVFIGRRRTNSNAYG